MTGHIGCWALSSRDPLRAVALPLTLLRPPTHARTHSRSASSSSPTMQRDAGRTSTTIAPW
eukprot:CAMPEP_0182610734 /NCGR_PEP_ID=MMETSP1330-20130603/10092_1 /TAXON_ID=464278 /ORGANISM="Picochlorum sp., Strain RCC944" /LENGTH=60 /DNA_ID=CAMNT_0024829995 /DNA_START=63 /DNA_END=242 /DNA_ORIENTATION=-